MTPMSEKPEVMCVECDRPAIREYEGEPSCGGAWCELRIQAAKDYNEERG